MDGALWARISTQFDALRRAESQIDVIQALLDQRDSVRADAQNLHARCALAGEPVARIQAQLGRDRIIGRTWDEVKRLGGALTYTREATDRERQMNPALWMVPVSKGRMDATGLAEPAAMLGRLQRSVIDHLDQLDLQKAISLNQKELDRYTRFVSQLKDGLRIGRVYLIDAEKFLRPQNWVAFEEYCRESGVRFGANGPAIFREIQDVARTADRSWAEPRQI